ncbi:hypothetical protein ACFV8T_42925 [Streptomyces sp. NPDC059832]|uniref:hypothetical protein n=1 Tax=unclassified Streptomyces TaxID=2593676 RepID=UPI00365D6894
MRGETPDAEKRLRKQVVKLKELRAADAEENKQLRVDVEALVGALCQSQMENRQLRKQLADWSSNIRVLPTRPQPSPRAIASPAHVTPATDE